MSVVALDSLRVTAEPPLSGRPRWALYDDERDRVYANIREPAEITVIDADRLSIERPLPVPSAGPHGLWLDAGRLFCAADGGALVMFDADRGEVVERLPLPGVPDVLMHNLEQRRLYVAIGDPGLVCSFDSDRLEQVGTIETERGAHTTGWDPAAAASSLLPGKLRSRGLSGTHLSPDAERLAAVEFLREFAGSVADMAVLSRIPRGAPKLRQRARPFGEGSPPAGMGKPRGGRARPFSPKGRRSNENHRDLQWDF